MVKKSISLFMALLFIFSSFSSLSVFASEQENLIEQFCKSFQNADFTELNETEIPQNIDELHKKALANIELYSRKQNAVKNERNQVSAGSSYGDCSAACNGLKIWVMLNGEYLSSRSCYSLSKQYVSPDGYIDVLGIYYFADTKQLCLSVMVTDGSLLFDETIVLTDNYSNGFSIITLITPNINAEGYLATSSIIHPDIYNENLNFIVLENPGNILFDDESSEAFSTIIFSTFPVLEDMLTETPYSLSDFGFAPQYLGKTAQSYTISYNANGGSGAPGSQSVTAGGYTYLSSTIPSRSGYDFLGWSTSSTATTASYKPGAYFTTSKSVTLYAVWKKHTHSYSTKTYKPTCTEIGYTVLTCSCGDTYTDAYKDALGHSFTNYVYNGDADTEHDGTETAKCERCSKTDTRVIIGSKATSSFISVPQSAYVDYRSKVKFTATVDNIPKKYSLALYEGSSIIAKSEPGEKSISFTSEELKDSKVYSVKILTENGEIAKRTNHDDISKEFSVNVDKGFFKKFIAFFKGLFGTLPTVNI